MLFTECEHISLIICLHTFINRISTSTFMWSHHSLRFQELKFCVFFLTLLASSELLDLY